MSSTLYKKAYEQMIALHSEQFAEFMVVHDQYRKDQSAWQSRFDELGKPILRLIEDTENRLCSKMEGAGRSNYSGGLAEKFRQEVRSHIPLIDMVGVTIT